MMVMYHQGVKKGDIVKRMLQTVQRRIIVNCACGKDTVSDNQAI
jgi:hypothetical protein